MPKLAQSQKLLVLLSLILMWPALLNGTPFIFPDTSSYLREADAAIYHLTGHASEWSEIIQNDPPKIENAAPAKAASVEYQSSFHKNVLLGRTIYYGFFIYIGVFLGSLWIPIALQAVATGIVIVGWTKLFIDPAKNPQNFTLTVVAVNVCALLTSLPYYISILMPDIFSGLIVLACPVLVVSWQKETIGWRLLWLCLLIFSALAHGSNILILIVLAVLALAIAPLFRRPLPWAAAAIMVIAALTGFVGEVAFKAAVQHTIGREALRPPFLSARLIADGPGTAFLKETCPASGFTYCKYQNRITPFSDNILWSEEESNGIFSATTPAIQAQIASEEMRFVREVFFRYPVWTLRTVMENAAEQSVSGGLSEFNLPFDRDRLVASKFPKNTIEALMASRGQHGDMPIGLYKVYAPVLILLSLGLLGSTWFRSSLRPYRYPAALVIAGVFANALICGAMSGAHERYQDRVIWVPILWAVLLIMTRAGPVRSAERLATPVAAD